jgi:hypothetical protein
VDGLRMRLNFVHPYGESGGEWQKSGAGGLPGQG